MRVCKFTWKQTPVQNRLAVRDSNVDSDTDDPHSEAESEEKKNNYFDFGILESELDEEFDY